MGKLPDTIKRLIDRFDRQSDQLRSPDYNETLIRIDFINPLMSELGWDIDNRQGFAEQYREVVHEDRVRVAGQTKAPDYSFRIGGQRKFFLEAKKPAIDIKNSWEPAYQLRRYAWSAKLACSILTDFEEFAIYDTRIQPKQMEKASVARREYIGYKDYESRWDFLYGTFSKDAVLKGDFDRYCESQKGRGAQLFDDAFLAEIEQWRKTIAASLARHNESLDQGALNFAVQRIIDRIIFLRIAEDRGTETVGQLQGLLNGDCVYSRLCTLFRRADERYNSGLFHFAKEKDRDETPDTLTPSLDVDDRTLKTIIRALYYPESPYEFTMVSADILGSVYERFLGKVITLTTGHNAKIEEKPEVRKAGGVYYTPKYIVDYIVQNTIGKLLGMGSGVLGLEGRSGYGHEDIPGTGSVGTGDAAGGTGVRIDATIAQVGTVRADQPTAAGGGVGAGEHRRGIRENTPGRLPASSLDCPRIAGGTGNPACALRTPEDDRARSHAINLESDADNRQTPGRPPSRSQNPQTPNPKPQTPILKPRLKILDPACGSGSFLIGAYQYLLDWYHTQYTASDPASLTTGKKPLLRPTPSGGYALTIAERKRILLDHIHGVDLDSQAVEVTKLNLLLKCLEGETSQTLGFEQRLFRERALPDLGKNILCGNSLIGTDIIGTDAWKTMSEEERARINPFDYKRAFPVVFKGKDAGFDAVIGNPPYVRIQTVNEQSPTTAAELKRRFCAASEGNFDLYVLFIELGMRLLNRSGRFGMILPSKFTNSDYGAPVREIIACEQRLHELVDFGSAQVFDGATTYTCLLFLGTESRDHFEYEQVRDISRWTGGLNDERGTIPTDSLKSGPWTFRIGPRGKLAQKLDAVEPKLGDIADVFVGMQTSADAIYILDVTRKTTPTWGVVRKGETIPFELEADLLRPILSGTDVKAYRSLIVRQCVIFPYSIDGEVARLRSFEEIREVAPRVAKYLNANRKALEARERSKFADVNWYRFGRNQNIGIQGRVKLCVPRLVERLNAAFDANGSFCLDNVDVNGVTIKREETRVSLRYVLGLLNSRLIGWYFPFVSAPFRGNWYSANRQFLDRVPIAMPTNGQHAALNSLVDSMLSLHQKFSAEKLPQRREQLQREIDATDRQIDQLVYELYGLTQEEIAIVESATA